MEKIKHDAEWHKARAIERKNEKRARQRENARRAALDVEELEKEFAYLKLRK